MYKTYIKKTFLKNPEGHKKLHQMKYIPCVSIGKVSPHLKKSTLFKLIYIST